MINLPVPKIQLKRDISYILSVDTSFGPQVNFGKGLDTLSIRNAPEIKVNDFSDEFLEKYDVRVEMVHWRKPKTKWRQRKQIKVAIGGCFVADADYALSGWRMPWPENFWTRNRQQYEICSPAGFKGPLKTSRPNCYRVVKNGQSIPVWEYLNGRYTGQLIEYVNDTLEVSNLKCYVPITNRIYGSSNGRKLMKGPYSIRYSKYYIAFRYIVWDPTANEGRGQIFEGPLSQTVEISNFVWPFHIKVKDNGVKFCEPPLDWEDEDGTNKEFRCKISKS